MSEILSNSSEDSEFMLLQQKADLTAQQQKLNRDIKKSQLILDGYQYDLEIAKQSMTLANTSFVQRSKKLMNLFNGRIKSDEELISNIESMMKSIENDKAKAKIFRDEIGDMENQISTKNSDHEFLLNKLKEEKENSNKFTQLIDEKKAKLIETKNKITQKQQISKKYNQIFDLIQEQTSTSHQRFNTFSPKILQKFKELADLIQLREFTHSNINISNFFDSIFSSFKKLQTQFNEKEEIRTNIIKHIQQKNKELHLQKQKIKNTKNEIKKLQNDLQQKRINNNEKKLNEVRKQEKLKKLKEIEVKSFNNVLMKVNAKHKASDNPKILVDEEIKFLNDQIRLLQKAILEQQQRNKISKQILQKSVSVVENATDQIMESNFHLYNHFCCKY